MHKSISTTCSRIQTQIKQLLRQLELLLLWICIITAAVCLQSVEGEQRADELENSITDVRVDRLLVMTTVRDIENESFKRFNRSIETYKLDLSVLQWPTISKRDSSSSSNNNNLQAGSQLSLIKKALATYKNEANLLIMIVDSQNSILNGDQKSIVSRFSSLSKKGRVIFAADQLATSAAEGRNASQLNSGAYIGFATALWELLLGHESDEGGDSQQQAYFTGAFANESLRNKIGLHLDDRSELFQSLKNNENLDLRLEMDTDGVELKNLAHGTEPVVILADTESKIALNSLGNYLARAWTLSEGCRHCDHAKLILPKDEDALPSVLVGIFIEYPTPFLGDFFDDLVHYNYPAAKMHLLIHNTVPYHEPAAHSFLERHGPKYASQQVISSSEPEWKAREAALTRCLELNCDYYLALDSVARLELADALRLLIETNKTIVAPLLNRPTKLWSNFWGAITEDGFYARSHDYVDLVKRERTGLWNVPHVMNAYLVNGHFIRANLKRGGGGGGGDKVVKLSYRDDNSTRALKPVLMFTSNLRDADIHQHLLNTHEFGHLIDPTTYNISLTRPDFYQLAENVLDWERTYLHENYSRIVEEEDVKLEQPCQDVFWFPLVNDNFCNQLIEIMERFGEWSGGTNNDPRIEGGYESVPTRDIHMKQVGLHDMWLLFLRDYVMPVQLKEYIGYEHDPPRANLAFVVRYHPAEQASLQPHHDSSTYTLNIALNTPGLDYQGGGCRFERYNCSVTESRRGWALMHPGRLTHYHEGLPVTSGTRYIMVTFVDP